jgi:hypothetical protein
MPASRQRCPKTSAVYWADSTGRRNASTVRSCDGGVEEAASVESGGAGSDAFPGSASGGAA